MPTQLNALNKATQLSQAAMHFDGFPLDHQFPRRLSMPGQLKIVSPARSPPLNALANAPPAPNPPQEHIKVPALTSSIFNPVSLHFPLTHQHSVFLLCRHKHSQYTPITPWRIMSIRYLFLRLHNSFPPQTFLQTTIKTSTAPTKRGTSPKILTP